jgi:hypothetical protein
MDQNIRSVSSTEFSSEEIAQALVRDFGTGDWHFEAANRLISEHRKWLQNPEFFQYLRMGTIDGRDWIGIDWKDLSRALRNGAVRGDEEDLKVLDIAASMTGYGDRVDLSSALENHDQDTLRAIFNAMLHVGGWTGGLSDILP